MVWQTQTPFRGPLAKEYIRVTLCGVVVIFFSKYYGFSGVVVTRVTESSITCYYLGVFLGLRTQVEAAEDGAEFFAEDWGGGETVARPSRARTCI